MLHDICMQDLHVTMCLDRAGIVGDDGLHIMVFLICLSAFDAQDDDYGT